MYANNECNNDGLNFADSINYHIFLTSQQLVVKLPFNFFWLAVRKITLQIQPTGRGNYSQINASPRHFLVVITTMITVTTINHLICYNFFTIVTSSSDTNGALNNAGYNASLKEHHMLLLTTARVRPAWSQNNWKPDKKKHNGFFFTSCSSSTSEERPLLKWRVFFYYKKKMFSLSLAIGTHT